MLPTTMRISAFMLAWSLCSALPFTNNGAAIALQDISLSPSPSVPDTASPPIDPSFPGFSFEERSFVLYAGGSGETNTFSKNLIDVIGQKIGVSPIVRVGGTSLDYATFYPNQADAFIVPSGQTGKNIPFGLEIGPSYFKSFQNLPDVQYIVDIPLVQNNLPNSLDFARVAVQTIPQSQQFAWEIGNEPDLYPHYPKNATGPVDYLSDWLRFSKSISSVLSSNGNKVAYEVYTRSSPQGDQEEAPWTVEKVFMDGFDQVADSIKTVSIHYYQTQAGQNLQQSLMNHMVTSARAGYFREPAEYLANSFPDIPLVLAEIGSATNPTYNDNALEGVLGSALWQIDFLLSSMTVGVGRINYQGGIGFGYAMWQPTTFNNTAPHVRAPFYGQVFVADFIGPNIQAKTPTGRYRSSQGGSELRVSELTSSDPFLAAYAAYENGALSRVALVNLQLWDSSIDSGNRPQKTISLIVPSGVNSVSVEQLTSTTGGLASAEGDITWGGKSWTYADEGLGTQQSDDTKVYKVSNGQVVIPVDASSAVIVSLQS